MIVLYVVFALVYLCCPLPVQILLFIINSIVPDSIPVLDELLMIAAVLGKIRLAGSVFAFKEEHPILFYIILAAILIALFLFVKAVVFS